MHPFWKVKHPPLQPFHLWNAHSLLLTFDHMHKVSSPLPQSEEAFTICIQSLNSRISGNSFVSKPEYRALWDNMVKNDNKWFLITATRKVHREFGNTIGFYLIGEAHKEGESEPKILLPIWSEVLWWGQEPWHSFMSRHSVIFSVQMTDPLPLPYAMLT
jgi:hypothetical protein